MIYLLIWHGIPGETRASVSKTSFKDSSLTEWHRSLCHHYRVPKFNFQHTVRFKITILAVSSNKQLRYPRRCFWQTEDCDLSVICSVPMWWSSNAFRPGENSSTDKHGVCMYCSSSANNWHRYSHVMSSTLLALLGRREACMEAEHSMSTVNNGLPIDLLGTDTITLHSTVNFWQYLDSGQSNLQNSTLY
jgi:hypothetical protein